MSPPFSHRIRVAAVAAILFAGGPAAATDWSIGGAWSTLEEDSAAAAPEQPRDMAKPSAVSLAFAAPSTTLPDTDLTLGYAPTAFDTNALNTELADLGWSELARVIPDRSPTSDVYGAFTTSVLGGDVGVFGGVEDVRSAFAMEPAVSRTVGASVGYAGFYLQGAYQDAGPDGLLDGRRAWQAGLGYGSDDFDVRVTYVQSAFLQGSPTELEGKQWMIGGLVQLTPSILLNANAFYIDQEMIMPTVEPPGTGARVGLQLRF